MEVSWKRATPWYLIKSSILVGIFIINQTATVLGIPMTMESLTYLPSALYLISLRAALVGGALASGSHAFVAWLRGKGGDVGEQRCNIDISYISIMI